MRIALIVLLLPLLGCMDTQDLKSIQQPTAKQIVEASDGAKELIEEQKSENPKSNDAIDFSIVNKSDDLVAQLQAEVLGNGNEWWFTNTPGPGGSLMMRKPITDETASQLLDAWKRPTVRVLTAEGSEGRLEDFVRGAVAECLESKDTTVRKMRLEQWDFEIHLEPGKAGGRTFASLEFIVDIHKFINEATAK